MPMRGFLPFALVLACVPALTSQAVALEPDGSRLVVVSPEAFLQQCHADIDAARAAVAKFKSSKGVGDPVALLDLYDAAYGLIANARDRSSLTWNVHPDAAVREAATTCESDVDKAYTELTLDRDVFAVLTRLDVSRADTATQNYVKRLLRDFKRAGVDLDEATRARITELREELVRLGQEFGSTVASDVRSIEIEPGELDGLPDDFKRAHPANANGRVVLTTNNTDYVPFLTYAKSEAARERLWTVYRQRGAPQNLDTLGRMLAARYELAKLLGFETWADYVTGDKMIGTRQNVASFIARIVAAAEPRMLADYQQILAHKRKSDPSARAVNAWDSQYLQEQVKTTTFEFDSQSVRPYFEYNRVKQGVMDMTSELFNISYRRVTDAPVWHPDVEVYDVLDLNSRVLGRIYLDMFPREDKYKHYAQFALVNGKEGRALPEGVLVCNFPKPGADPALMLHSDVETLFHEWGHLLHHVFGGHTIWAGISGVNTEWDFVEAPSQMLEEWTWRPETLTRFARHVETGQPIPLELITKMRAANEFGKGLYVRQQMFYAAISLEFHSRDPKGLDTTALVAELQRKYTPFDFVDGTFFEASFTHLDGYSAIYYTYMWSLVIAKDMFTAFSESGLLDQQTAARYRRTVLDQGASKPAAELVHDFLGRPYDFEAYEAWLNR